MGDRRIYKVLSTVDRPIAMWDFCSCSHLGQWEKSALTENTERFSRCSKRQCLCNTVSIICDVDSVHYDKFEIRFCYVLMCEKRKKNIEDWWQCSLDNKRERGY